MCFEDVVLRCGAGPASTSTPRRAVHPARPAGGGVAAGRPARARRPAAGRGRPRRRRQPGRRPRRRRRCWPQIARAGPAAARHRPVVGAPGPWRSLLAGLFEGALYRPFLDDVTGWRSPGNSVPGTCWAAGCCAAWSCPRRRSTRGRPSTCRSASPPTPTGRDGRVLGRARPAAERVIHSSRRHRRTGPRSTRRCACATSWPSRSLADALTRMGHDQVYERGPAAPELRVSCAWREGRRMNGELIVVDDVAGRVRRAGDRGVPQPARRELLARPVGRRHGPPLLRAPGRRRRRPDRLVAGRRLLGRRALRRRPTTPTPTSGWGARRCSSGWAPPTPSTPCAATRGPTPTSSGWRRLGRFDLVHLGLGPRRPHRVAVPRLRRPRRRPRAAGGDERGPARAATPTSA